MLSIVPKANPKLESRNPDNIDKEVFFKFLVISKDITLMGRFLNWKFQIYLKYILFKGVLTPNLLLKMNKKVRKPISLTKT